MKMKISSYITQLLVEHNIIDVFTLVGGGAMHLNDSFGNHPQMKCIYMLHEQAATIAAEAYARVDNRLPLVCVTTGPGGTNTLTGVLCAWQDNIPMLIISGQVKYQSTVESTGLKLRQFGEQEHSIIETARSMTKYAVTIKDASTIRYHIEKAIHLAVSGRRGPCWIEIPLDIQGAQIEIDNLEGYMPDVELKMPFDCKKLKAIIEKAKRPAILVGSAIRTSEAKNEFMKLVKRCRIPVVAAKSNADLLPLGERFYYGNFGTNGGRAGNFIVQNADCLFVLGCRLSFGQIGFNYEKFSPYSQKIVIDVDINELKKNTAHIDLPIHMDLKEFINWFCLSDITFKETDTAWLYYCDEVRSKFPIYQEKYSLSNQVNPYYFAEQIKKYLDDNSICIVGNSCSCISIKQCGIEQINQRLWGNINCGTMGYDLPAAIGASIASKRRVICYAGDGSIQLNIQELQTIINYDLPIKIFIFNNSGYRSIVLSQENSFGRLSGCTQETGLKLPDIQKIATAYGIPYCKCESNSELNDILSRFLNRDGYGICEIIEDCNHMIEPRLSNKILPDGQIVSPPLSNLAPFLDEKVYLKYMKYQEEQDG